MKNTQAKCYYMTGVLFQNSRTSCLYFFNTDIQNTRLYMPIKTPESLILLYWNQHLLIFYFSEHCSVKYEFYRILFCKVGFSVTSALKKSCFAYSLSRNFAHSTSKTLLPILCMKYTIITIRRIWKYLLRTWGRT